MTRPDPDTAALVAFVRARLAEDEERAQQLDGETWYQVTRVGGEYNYAVVTNRPDDIYPVMADCGAEDGVSMSEERAEHVARWDPARVLREVAAKRQLVEEYVNASVCADTEKDDEIRNEWEVVASTREAVVRVLAAVHEEHPDYRQEWRP